MILGANIREAVRSLYGAKQRTILALIGIIIGIGSVIAMVSTGKIVEQETLRQFKEMGTDILTVRKGGGRGGRQESYLKKIKLEQALNIPAHCPSISSSAPFIQASMQIKYKGKQIYSPCIGVTHSFKDLNKINVEKGRFISDLDHFSPFCTIGKELAEKLAKLGLSDPIGKKIKANDYLFTIIGILENVPTGGMRPYGINDGIMIPITTASRSVENAEINDITIRMKPNVHHTTAKKELTAYFRKVLGIDLDIYSAEELIERMEEQMKLFTLLLGAIGSISLVVGGVGVMNVMLVSVSERRKEIGIRRALGAKTGDIQSQFLVESMILSLIGGIIGINLGILSSYIISHFSNWHFLVSYSAILLGVGVSSVVGIFFGFYPARSASKLDPITALRSD